MGQNVIQCLALHNQANQNVQHRALVITYKNVEADRACASFNAIANGCASTYHGGTENAASVMQRFQAPGEPTLRILVVCGKLLEGFDCKPVSVVGILRNISISSKVLMNQFVGKCFFVSFTPAHVFQAVLLGRQAPTIRCKLPSSVMFFISRDR